LEEDGIAVLKAPMETAVEETFPASEEGKNTSKEEAKGRFSSGKCRKSAELRQSKKAPGCTVITTQKRLLSSSNPGQKGK